MIEIKHLTFSDYLKGIMNGDVYGKFYTSPIDPSRVDLNNKIEKAVLQRTALPQLPL